MNNMDEFTKDKQNIYDNLALSPKLYGREEQIKQLLDNFEQTLMGNTQLLLVSGYSGIGKTSLVNELNEPIKKNNSIFIKGKYDQLQRSTPYSAIIEAFKDLIGRLLADPDKKLKTMRDAWLAVLGNNGKIIVDVIPEIAFIIGKQPPVPELSPAEEQNRFMITLQNFIRAIAQPEHPLVLFLDDLQWIDIASLQLINALLSDYDLKYFLLVGAYRDNELKEYHPLTVALNKFKELGIPVNKISLASLTKEDIENYLKDSFNCNIEQVKSLASLLLEKTHGNPFFINQFLNVLYHKKLLTFYDDRHEWQWDNSNVELNENIENIISLLTFRIHQLSDKSQSLLKLASCIGHIFDLKTLAIINEQSVPETIQTLADPISLNLIIPIDGNHNATILTNEHNTEYSTSRYQFIHDHVQNAAYTLIENDLRQQVHLRIGRMLLKDKVLLEGDNTLFDIVNHFVESLSLITDPSEKKQIAKYCLWAGKKSKASSAYQAAKNYLLAASLLLNPISTTNSSKLTFSVYKELAVCKYLTGDFEKAENDFQTLIACTTNITNKLECYKLYCAMLATRNRHTDAITHGLIALKLMGITIPSNPNLFHILCAILRIKLQLRGRHIQNVDLLPIKNSRQRAAIDLISQMFNSAFIINQNLFLLLTCTNVNLGLRYGYSDSTGFACVVYAFIMMHALNRYNEGIDFVECYNILAQIHLAPSFSGRSHFVLGSFIYPYRYPITMSFETIAKAYQFSYETGDLAYSNYSNILLIIMAQMAGYPISKWEKLIKTTLTFSNKIKMLDFKTLANFYQYSLKCLTQSEIDNSHILKFEQEIIQNKNTTEKCFFYSACTKLYFHLDNFSAAKEFGKKHLQIESYALGMVSILIGIFYYSLAISSEASYLHEISREHQIVFLKSMKKIKRWMKWCPTNFKAYYLLMIGEHARLVNKPKQAINLYKDVIEIANKQNMLDTLAIANERVGNLYLVMNFPKKSKLYLQKAHDTYRKWGALKKCQLLAQQYPFVCD